jgi:hypothetical protein
MLQLLNHLHVVVDPWPKDLFLPTCDDKDELFPSASEKKSV